MKKLLAQFTIYRLKKMLRRICQRRRNWGESFWLNSSIIATAIESKRFFPITLLGQIPPSNSIFFSAEIASAIVLLKFLDFPTTIDRSFSSEIPQTRLFGYISSVPRYRLVYPRYVSSLMRETDICALSHVLSSRLCGNSLWFTYSYYHSDISFVREDERGVTRDVIATCTHGRCRPCVIDTYV